ncbi:MAG: nuclear transport factor 2 family protein [Proteobacteria bacterium]|nr:nuclear transport factor 2 family protein [Pseudomonadota bacterium]
MSDLQNLADQQEIYALSCHYMRGLDRLDRTLLHSVFSADAYCEYGFINGTPEVFIDYAITALEGHIANHHMIGNHLIEFEGEEAFGEIYFNAYHKVPDASGPLDIVIAGRYLDRYVKINGEWKMAYRSERVDWSRTQPTQDPYFAGAPLSLLGERSTDAVYRRDNRCWPTAP